MDTSTSITVIYFITNILLLLILSLYIIIKSDRIPIKSLFKDVWAQRKIYTPVIVHFYDTATDFGVLYYWYTLMIDEQNGIDYNSVNMETFFWCGVVFLWLYRVLLFFTLIFGCSLNDENVKWYDPILVIFDIYVFRTVYMSFVNAKSTLEANLKRRKSFERLYDQLGSQSNHALIFREWKIEIHYLQQMALLAESVTESLPQIMLQLVFIIRSYNDERLRDDEIWLILLSILASLLSISNKFVCDDEDRVIPKAKSLKLQGCSHGLCCNMETWWYAIRVVWRLCHITTNFVVYVLIWTVLGGAWLPVWCFILFLFYSVISEKVERREGQRRCAFPLVYLAGILDDEYTLRITHFVKWGVVLMELAVIAVFATTSFECGICTDANQRSFHFVDDHGMRNYAISITYGIGCLILLIEMLLFLIRDRKGIFRMRP